MAFDPLGPILTKPGETTRRDALGPVFTKPGEKVTSGAPSVTPTKRRRSSGGGSSSSSRRRAAEATARAAAAKAVAEAKAKAEREAAEKKKKAEEEARKKAEEEAKRLEREKAFRERKFKQKLEKKEIKKQLAARDLAIRQREGEAEKRRIEETKKRIKSQGGQTRTRTLRDAGTGAEIIQTVTIIDKLEKGKRIKERVFETKNLRTGEKTIKTFSYDPKTKRTFQSGGLSSFGTTKKDVEEIQKNLPAGEKLIFNPLTFEIKGIRSALLKQNITFTQKGLDFYNKSIEKLEEAASRVAPDKISAELLKIKEKRIVLRNELNQIQTERKNRLNKIDTWRNNQIKSINSRKIPEDRKTELLRQVNIEAIEKRNVVKKDLDRKGITIQNKLLGETGKSIGLGVVQLAIGAGKLAFAIGKGAFEFGQKIQSSAETRRDIVNVVKSIPKYAYLTGKTAFEIGQAISGDKELRDKFIGYGKTAISNLDVLTKESRDEAAYLIKTSPVEAVLIVGAEILLLKGTGKAFKIVNKVNKAAIGGTVKLGQKVISKSAYLTKAIKVAGNPVRFIKKQNTIIVEIAAKTKKGIIQKVKVSPIGKPFEKKRLVLTKREKVLRKAKLPSAEDRIVEGVKLKKKEFKSLQSALKEVDKERSLRKLIEKVETGKTRGFSERIKGKILTESEKKLLSGLKGIPKESLKNVKSIDVTVLTNKIKFTIPRAKRFGTLKKGFWRLVREPKELYQNTVSYGLIDAKGKFLGSISFSVLSPRSINRFRNVANALKFGGNKRLIISRNYGKAYVQSLVKSLDKRIKPTLDEFVSKFKTIKKDGFFFEKGIGEIQIKTPLKITQLITKKVRRARKLKGIKKKFKLSPEVSRERIKERKLAPFREKILKKRGVEITKKKEQTIIESIRELEKVSPEINLGRLERFVDAKLPKFTTKEIQSLKSKIINLNKNRDIIRKNFGLNVRKISSNIANLENKLLKATGTQKIQVEAKIRKLNKLRDRAFSKTQNNLGNLNKLRIKLRINIIDEEIKEGIRRIPKMRKISRVKLASSSPKQKLLLVKKISRELKEESSKILSRKAAKAAASIPSKVRYGKRIDGLRELKKLQRIRSEAKRAMLKRGIRGIEKLRLGATIKAIDRLMKQLSRNLSKSAFKTLKGQVKKQDQIVDKLQEQIKKTAQDTILKTKLVSVPRFVPPIIPRIPRIPKKPKPPEKKKPRIFIPRMKKGLQYKTLAKPEQTFKVLGKIRGKQRLLLKDLTRKDALNFLSYESDHRLLRTTHLIPTGKRKRVVKLPKKYSGYYAKTKFKLREFKIRKGKKKPFSGYIERLRYSGDTKSEILELKASRRKRTKSRRKK